MLNHLYPRVLLSVFTACASIPMLAAENGEHPPVTSRSVWRANNETVEKVRAACLNSGIRATECFVQQMQKAGASPEAIAFVHLLHDDAYLAKFQNTGPVSIAWVIYPYRANSNTGCLLVNGLPPVVDIDDLSRLPVAKLKSDPGWKTLAEKHPKAMLWPDDRSGMSGIREIQTPGGGQEFIAGYLVLEGCHACARLARVHYAFDFDATGKLLGAHFLDLQAMQ